MLRRLLGRLANALAFLGGIAVVLMMLHICADVIAKYVFNSPIPGTLEIVSNYYMVATVFLPLALVERKNAHIAVEILSQHLPTRGQAVTLPRPAEEDIDKMFAHEVARYAQP